MGPFGSKLDLDNYSRNKSSWYKDYAEFILNSLSWFVRGATWDGGVSSGNFAFGYYTGDERSDFSYRIVLAP